MANATYKLEIPLALDKTKARPLYMQLRDALVEAVGAARLKAGTRVPSTRHLAEQLGVSRIVTVAAYEELLAQGYLVTRHGDGTFVNAFEGKLPSRPKASRAAPAAAPRTALSFAPGHPDAAAIDPVMWRRAWRAMASEKTHTRVEAAGDRRLRTILSEYISRTRGFHATADDIIITSGTAQALSLLGLALRLDGMDLIGVENPGYRRARRIFRHLGMSMAPLPVDEYGLMTSSLKQMRRKKPGAIYVTPSHQYPMGGTLPLDRRLQLLEWCRKNDAYVIEDDFDSEFRFDTLPIPALKSIDTDGCVAYIGTFSKIVSADLRLAYLIPPPALRARVMQLKNEGYDFTPWPVQCAAYHMMHSGGLERHVRRMRLVYARRRKLVQNLLGALPDGFEIVGDQAGLHLVLLCPQKTDIPRIVRLCAEKNVTISPLSDFYLGRPAMKGLVIGYGHLKEKEIRKGCAALIAACHGKG